MDFSAKDFRLWAGSLNILRCFKSMDPSLTQADNKRNILSALDEVSSKLGNTRTVCRKYYVHPGIIRLYEEDGLGKYLKELDDSEDKDESPELHHDEKVPDEVAEGASLRGTLLL